MAQVARQWHQITRPRIQCIGLLRRIHYTARRGRAAGVRAAAHVWRRRGGRGSSSGASAAHAAHVSSAVDPTPVRRTRIGRARRSRRRRRGRHSRLHLLARHEREVTPAAPYECTIFPLSYSRLLI